MGLSCALTHQDRNAKIKNSRLLFIADLFSDYLIYSIMIQRNRRRGALGNVTVETAAGLIGPRSRTQEYAQDDYGYKR
jgi:hypothetical protein